MAQKVLVSLVDDLDGSEAKETVIFGLDGVNYEIDLNEKNAQKLRKGFETFVPKARKVGKAASAQTAKGSAPKRTRRASDDSQAIREWAATQGMQVSERGRISTQVREAYDAAHAPQG